MSKTRQRRGVAKHDGYRAIAAYYDHEFTDLDFLTRDVPFFLEQLPRSAKRLSILELAVGTARAALPLAQAGHRVVGVDYDQDLLDIAERKRGAVGVGSPDLSLLHGDVLDLDLGRRFDWVCFFFNTFLAFPTLEQQDHVLQVVRRHLKRDGRFWLDVFQPNVAALPHEVEQNLDPTAFYVPELARTVFKTTEVRRDPAEQMTVVKNRYRWFDEFGQPHEQSRSFAMTFVFPRELRILLERNGLRIERMWGDYDGSDLTSHSPRMIVRCRKG